MKVSKHIVKISWDTEVLGIDTYEIGHLSREVMDEVSRMSGHFTVKLDPLSSKKILHENNFYYCDTLIEPHCTVEMFIPFEHDAVSVVHLADIGQLADMTHYDFSYDRFHRDFNIKKERADLRYSNWLKQLCDSESVFVIMFSGHTAGFFGFSGNRILLHAIDREYRGKGLAKYFWTAGYKELFARGYKELTSSISVSNVPALNLYCSLGFRFRNPLDVYHRFIVQKDCP